jgi:hypothetical protein
VLRSGPGRPTDEALRAIRDGAAREGLTGYLLVWRHGYIVETVLDSARRRTRFAAARAA